MPKSRSRQKEKRRPYVPAPQKKKRKPSPRWFGWLVLGVMAVGVILIVGNYMGLVPGGTSQLYLWLGLGLIGTGFGLATQLR